MIRITVTLSALAAVLVSSAFAADAQKASQKQCEDYGKNAVAHNKENMELRCGFKGSQWSSDYKHHYDWCMQGRPVSTLGAQSRDRENAIERCKKGEKGGQAAAKGPSQKTCEGIMRMYKSHMTAGNKDQAQCQKLAAANKPTGGIYKQYLKECNDQDSVGRNFYKQGCDKAFPNMPSPGQGPNECAQQVAANCPKK